jgi:hypothetical protein
MLLEQAAGKQHLIYQSGFPVINVGNNSHIAKSAHTFTICGQNYRFFTAKKGGAKKRGKRIPDLPEKEKN